MDVATDKAGLNGGHLDRIGLVASPAFGGVAGDRAGVGLAEVAPRAGARRRVAAPCLLSTTQGAGMVAAPSTRQDLGRGCSPSPAAIPLVRPSGRLRTARGLDVWHCGNHCFLPPHICFRFERSPADDSMLDGVLSSYCNDFQVEL
ncbi:hypothetical protein EJB05_19968, partial [Eragrostis curvula]